MSAVQNTEPGDADPRSPSLLESLLRTADQRWTLSSALSVLIVAGCSLFVLIVLNPALILADNTPTGGDMGAHVWGPAYLRDELLPNFRLTGWSPDWYAGFPAYQFYMIVPALAIVALNAGINPWIGVPVSICLAGLFTRLGRSFGIRPLYIVVASAVAATLLVSLPYGIAFKIVTVLGLIFFPVSVWFVAKMAHAPEPLPAFMAMGGTVFLFDASFWILGGNIMSTLAGEFSFSISITLVFFAVGLVFRGMDTGEWRARSAVVIALVALCHVIPLFFLVGLLAFVILLGRNLPRYPVFALVAIFAGLLFLTGPNTVSVRSMLSGFSNGSSVGAWSTVVTLVVIAVSVVLLVRPFIKNRELVTRATWLFFAGGAAALVAMFWLLPFWYQGDHFNDMGWSRLIEIGPKILTTPMQVCLPIAALGAVTSFLTRNRVGMLFSASAAVSLAAVANIPQGALWNERLLPFFFLSIYLLTSITIADWVRGLAMLQRRDFDRPSTWVTGIASIVGFAVLLVGISMPLRTLPFGEAQEDGSYTWGVFKSTELTKIPGWGRWNYAGYEGRNSYAEYHHVVTTMDEIGKTNGCGRAMWEFDDSLDRYGTPMALMLLPYWTDGCIGSMEGLFFESSATTPFHFLNQSVLSQEPSRAQRDLPYKDFDIDVGVAQLQTMGVKYYMALTDESIEAAQGHDELVELPDGDAAPFVVFEVRGAELVEGLEYDPVVVDENAGIPAEDEAEPNGEGTEEDRFETGWLSQAIAYYNDPNSFTALPAEDGPDSWRTVDSLTSSVGSPKDPIEVTDIEMGQDNVSFSVDEVGSPVLVKVSHFPNWQVNGAEGPWRVGPNLMVVVPTEKTVKLSYGRHPIDWISMLLTLLGIAAVVGFYRFDRRRRLTSPAAKQNADLSTTLTKDQSELWERLDQLGGPESENEGGQENGSEPDVDSDEDNPVPVVVGSGTSLEVPTEEHSGEGRSQLQQLESDLDDQSTIEPANDAAQPLSEADSEAGEPSSSWREEDLTAPAANGSDEVGASEIGPDERSTDETGPDKSSTSEPGPDADSADEDEADDHGTKQNSTGIASADVNGLTANGSDEHRSEGWLQLGMLEIDHDADVEEGDGGQSGSTGTEGTNIR